MYIITSITIIIMIIIISIIILKNFQEMTTWVYYSFSDREPSWKPTGIFFMVIYMLEPYENQAIFLYLHNLSYRSIYLIYKLAI